MKMFGLSVRLVSSVATTFAYNVAPIHQDSWIIINSLVYDASIFSEEDAFSVDLFSLVTTGYYFSMITLVLHDIKNHDCIYFPVQF